MVKENIWDSPNLIQMHILMNYFNEIYADNEPMQIMESSSQWIMEENWELRSQGRSFSASYIARQREGKKQIFQSGGLPLYSRVHLLPMNLWPLEYYLYFWSNHNHSSFKRFKGGRWPSHFCCHGDKWELSVQGGHVSTINNINISVKSEREKKII